MWVVPASGTTADDMGYGSAVMCLGIPIHRYSMGPDTRDDVWDISTRCPTDDPWVIGYLERTMG